MESQHSNYHHSFSYTPHFYSPIVPREVIGQNWNPTSFHHRYNFHAKTSQTSEKINENSMSSVSSVREGIPEQQTLENGRNVVRDRSLLQCSNSNKVSYQYVNFHQQNSDFAANKFYFPRMNPFSNIRCGYDDSRFEGYKFPWMKNTRSHHYEWKLQWQRGYLTFVNI